MVLDFSEGLPVSMLARRMPDLIEALERSVLPHPAHDTSPRHLADRDDYSWFLSLFTFAKLLHHDQYLSRLTGLLDIAYGR